MFKRMFACAVLVSLVSISSFAQVGAAGGSNPQAAGTAPQAQQATNTAPAMHGVCANGLHEEKDICGGRHCLPSNKTLMTCGSSVEACPQKNHPCKK